jgi:hypothetical protein
MENTYTDIQAQIRQANHRRSDALGEMLAMGWSQLKLALGRLAHHQPQKHAWFAHD